MPRALIMEDDVTVLITIAMVLREHGIEVRTAHDYRGFLDHLDAADRDANPFDVYLLDYWTGPRHRQVEGRTIYDVLRTQCGLHAPVIAACHTVATWQRLREETGDTNLHPTAKILTGSGMYHWNQPQVFTILANLNLLQPVPTA